MVCFDVNGEFARPRPTNMRHRSSTALATSSTNTSSSATCTRPRVRWTTASRRQHRLVEMRCDHCGFGWPYRIFFYGRRLWWSVIGRLAAPTLFFFAGYAQSRTVPLHWIWLGFILTLLDSWNADWTWVAGNVFFSFALIRIARPYVEVLLQHYGWVAFAFVVSALVAALPIASPVVDYGAEGWLWALFGLLHRMYVGSKSTTDANGATRGSAPLARASAVKTEPVRLLACVIAAVIYVWQEQKEFAFSQLQLAAVILGVSFLSACFYLFRRGPSRIQPPETIAGALRFVGRHTLEIYASSLPAPNSSRSCCEPCALTSWDEPGSRRKDMR